MGYDLSLVVGPSAVDPELICALCRGVLEKPAEALCGHLFCAACLSKRASLAAARCPHCGGVLVELGTRVSSQKSVSLQSDQSTSVSVPTPTPDQHNSVATANATRRIDSVRERLARVRVRCRNGCSMTFELGALAAHVANECPSTLVHCPHPRCPAILPRGELPAHSTRCGRELLPCVGCGARMPAAQLWAHEHRHRCLENLLRYSCEYTFLALSKYILVLYILYFCLVALFNSQTRSDVDRRQTGCRDAETCALAGQTARVDQLVCGAAGGRAARRVRARGAHSRACPPPLVHEPCARRLGRGHGGRRAARDRARGRARPGAAPARFHAGRNPAASRAARAALGLLNRLTARRTPSRLALPEPRARAPHSSRHRRRETARCVLVLTGLLCDVYVLCILCT